jgi:hypothetical protein
VALRLEVGSQPLPGVVHHLVECSGATLGAAGDLAEGDAAELGEEDLSLAGGERIVDGGHEGLVHGIFLEAARRCRLLEQRLGARSGVFEAHRLVLPASQPLERDVDRDRRRPGGKFAVSLEGVELLDDAKQAVLGRLVEVRL